MSLTVPRAEWLEGHAGKQVVAGSIPGGGTHYHFDFFAYGSSSHFGEGHRNEIKHDIHPDQLVHRDRFNIKTNTSIAAVYMTTGQRKQNMFFRDRIVESTISVLKDGGVPNNIIESTF